MAGPRIYLAQIGRLLHAAQKLQLAIVSQADLLDIPHFRAAIETQA